MNYTICTGCLTIPAFAVIANSPSLGKISLTPKHDEFYNGKKI
jgi:hypothetical protein